MLQTVMGKSYACGPRSNASSSHARSASLRACGRPPRGRSTSPARPSRAKRSCQTWTRYAEVCSKRAALAWEWPPSTSRSACARRRTRGSGSVFVKWCNAACRSAWSCACACAVCSLISHHLRLGEASSPFHPFTSRHLKSYANPLSGLIHSHRPARAGATPFSIARAHVRCRHGAPENLKTACRRR